MVDVFEQLIDSDDFFKSALLSFAHYSISKHYPHGRKEYCDINVPEINFDQIENRRWYSWKTLRRRLATLSQKAANFCVTDSFRGSETDSPKNKANSHIWEYFEIAV